MRISSVLIVAFAIFGSSLAVTKVRYDNYRLFNVEIRTEKQLKTLQQLEMNPDGIIFWESPAQVNMKLSMVVPPHKVAQFEEISENLDMDYKIRTDNIQEAIDAESPPRKGKADLGWDDYYSLEDINGFLDTVILNNPTIVTGFVAGMSHQRRPMRGVKISYKTGNPGIFVESNIHAREWITSATATYLINELLTSTNTSIRRIAEDYDWYILPVFNVDGFVYSHDVDRMWRKTRKQHSVLCTGVDPNRNFDYKWMNGGASSVPCTDTYAGPNPFSEDETMSFQAYYRSIASNIQLYLSFHSYGQYILFPFGDDNSPHPADYDAYMQISEATYQTLKRPFGTEYTYGTTRDALYIASGLSIDWVYGRNLAKLSFTYEFRDEGNFGFILPAAQIRPNAEEVIESLITITDETKARGFFALPN